MTLGTFNADDFPCFAITAVIAVMSTVIVPVRTLELTRLQAETGHTTAWVRLGLQFSQLIREVKIEFERQNMTNRVCEETM